MAEETCDSLHLLFLRVGAPRALSPTCQSRTIAEALERSSAVAAGERHVSSAFRTTDRYLRPKHSSPRFWLDRNCVAHPNQSGTRRRAACDSGFGQRLGYVAQHDRGLVNKSGGVGGNRK